MRFFTRLLGAASMLALAATSARAADAAMIEAAKKEGVVVWYTSQIINQLVLPVATAFEKKYGVKIEYVRANTGDIVIRIDQEAKAGKVLADVFDGTSPVAVLKPKNLVMKWVPDAAKDFPKGLVDPEGYWIADYIFIVVAAVNTDLVQKGTEPKGWQDLLDPKWRGKMAWSSSPSSSAAPGFVGLVLREYGEERGMAYLKQLATQKIAVIPTATRQVLDQVIAGEYPIALQAVNHHAVYSASRGAPVKWLPFEPGMVNLGAVSVTKDAPHPNAAKLLIDFLVSEEGQVIFRDNDYLPANPKVPVRDPSMIPGDKTFRGTVFTPEDIEAGMKRWETIFADLFR